MKKGAAQRLVADIDALPEDVRQLVEQAWKELCTQRDKEYAAQAFPVMVYAVMSKATGKKQLEQEWDVAPATVRRLKRQKAKQEAQPEGCKRPPGRPKGATKNADQLVPDFLTFQRIVRERAQTGVGEPMSDTQLARIIAEEAIRTTQAGIKPHPGGSFVDDDGSVVEIEVMASPPAGHYGGSRDGLKRRILAKTQSSRQPPAKGVKKTPPKT
jgi:hypothetical protein